MTHSTSQRTRYLADLNPPICSLKIASSFNKLNDHEKLYAHWMSRAGWAGARIIMNHWTPVAEPLYDFITTAFASASDPHKPASFEELKFRAKIPDEEWTFLLDYCAQALSNLCNYKSFGATKFIPRCAPTAFEALIAASERSQQASEIWKKVSGSIYNLEPVGHLDIGKPSAGHLSNYYPESQDITDDEINEVQAICDSHHLSTLNTRLIKRSPTEFTLLIASSSNTLDSTFPPSPLPLKPGKTSPTVYLQAADFSGPLSQVCAALQEARKYCGTTLREKMLDEYLKCFKTGNMNSHKEASRYWVKDVGPVVETYIGHIEAYVDPFAQRAEWEGFTAIVNKELSTKFEKLVDRADSLVKTLPWGKSFEVDVFRRPDFTALEVLSFATGGIPAGINIPNYFDVRESVGFKNVSLANILSAKAPNEEVTFIHPSERELYATWDSRTFDLQVANHELLGHGSGKQLQENADGTFNFDPETTINPLTGKPVSSWYKPGETYGSKFGLVASSMEECRAEAVALYLCSNREILGIFGYESEEDIETVQYMTFLLMARAGVRALEWYDPQTGKHGQAHMQARLGITSWLFSHGLATLEEIRGSDGSLEDAYVRVDREKVLSEGKAVIGKLLNEIQIRKSTADGQSAAQFYNDLTKPLSEMWSTELRELVLRKKQPRKIFVQPNTVVEKGNQVGLKEYGTTLEGVIESFVERGI
ncbi:hypothetical protein CROQUDRAFT_655859 [Cronartium quercuum f. sp. fusiforme G11]|uniref:Dipeptidyl peptidase 3 n=1 Tax=Cronartium quercuum f. sp. fusiforme G11 TaxID=708437 RepID=A0A9P6TEE3_9BASI|nr:hypothetical protein CROQUDRAFT_655859 [Cronartium quercuum f. sp. fusiforme G11]